MKYYKIKVDNIWNVITSNNFFIDNENQLLASNEVLSQYVEYNGRLYRDYWMAPIVNNKYQFIITDIQQITQEEYYAFKQAQYSNEAINQIIEEEEIEEPAIVEPTESDEFVEYIRSGKLKEMSRLCQQTIEAGFDFAVRGEIHHFSLTTQDQLNLMDLNLMAQTEDLIPYHADGEECTFYTPDEIREIIAAATNFKNYQIAYHNALKAYINALDTIEAIAAIEYGTPIPDEYKSDVLRVLE